MKRPTTPPRLLLLIIGLLILTGVGFAAGRQLGAGAPAAVALEPPALLDDDAFRSDAVSRKIQDEAGIAAYYKAPNTLNLELIRPLFNSIELETADYILGSISVPSYDEHFDAHVYVRRDGWIMAYYLSAAPTSKMIDTTAQNLDNSKLKTVSNNAAVTGGAPFGAVTYYNFNYPNATHMLLVGEYGADFEITIPSAYSYYELSWAGYSCIVIDNHSYPCEFPRYGSISLTSFQPDIVHSFDPSNYTFAALVIIYRMP